jgi:hypothetical protein
MKRKTVPQHGFSRVFCESRVAGPERSSRPMAWFSPEAGHRACLLIALQYLHGRILLAKL